jgi:hypothetical protein
MFPETKPNVGDVLIMKMNTENRSTYAMLVRSEDKGRSIFEVVVYALVALSVVLSIWQFAEQSNRLPIGSEQKPATVAVVDGVEPES